MSGTVGESNLRTDLQEELEDNLPQSTISLEEDKLPPRKADISQLEDTVVTTVNGTIEGFYTLLRKVFSAAAELDGLGFDIRFSKRYPTEIAQVPCFTTKLTRRTPMQEKGTRYKEIGMRYRREYEDPDFPGGIIEEYLSRQSNNVELSVWATNTNTLDNLCDWVEKVYWQYLWTLKWKGYQNIVWTGRGEDTVKKVRDQDVHVARLTFSVISSRIIKKRDVKLRKLNMIIGLNDSAISEELKHD